MSLIIKKNTTFKIPRTGSFLPSSLGGLSLWLKADAGITTFRNTYASQIILNGAYNTDFNGTYTATSEPDGNGDYSLNGPVYTMTYNKGANEYVVAFNSQYNAGSFISSDGVNWSILNSILNPAPYISGITGTYSNGNGQYGYAGDDPRYPSYNKYDNENYYSIDGGAGNWVLTYYEYGGDSTVLATNSNTIPSGSWTNVNATGTITSTATLYPQGSSPTGSVTTSEYGDFFVTEWADQSGNNNNAVPDEAYGLTNYLPSGLNSKPTIQFLGNGQNMSANIGFSIGENYSIFLVCSTSNNPATLISNDVFGGYWAGVAEFQLLATTQGDNDFSPIIAAPTQSTNGTPYIYTYTGSSFNHSIYTNGVAKGTAYYDGFLSTSSTTRIGASQIVGFALNGLISEVVIYNRVLTDTERLQVETYLNQKYQIY
jgi:hypothetical protein